MKIERIDDQTVKCFISNQELEQYGISYKDFIMRSDKARDVMEKIMKKVNDLVGYEVPGVALDLQIMMLPEQGMLLTLSEKTEGAQGTDGEDGSRADKESGHKDRMLQDTSGTADKRQRGQGAGKAAESGNVAETGVFAFHDLDAMIDLAAVLPAALRVESVLYKLRGEYYLEVSRSKASRDKFKGVCARAMEYGRLCPSGQAHIAYLQEHARVMIASKALRKLGGIKKS